MIFVESIVEDDDSASADECWGIGHDADAAGRFGVLGEFFEGETSDDGEDVFFATVGESLEDGLSVDGFDGDEDGGTLFGDVADIGGEDGGMGKLEVCAIGGEIAEGSL